MLIAGSCTSLWCLSLRCAAECGALSLTAPPGIVLPRVSKKEWVLFGVFGVIFPFFFFLSLHCC